MVLVGIVVVSGEETPVCDAMFSMTCPCLVFVTRFAGVVSGEEPLEPKEVARELFSG